ncbi:hypothetical protein [Chakrabartyella piscis]|nr:hypothetical protein [Chakrabartyella piscis]
MELQEIEVGHGQSQQCCDDGNENQPEWKHQTTIFAIKLESLPATMPQ